MNKLTTLASVSATALVVAATAATPALACQKQYNKPSHQTTQHQTTKKDCPPKKTTTTTTTKKNCPPKQTTPPKTTTKKPCPPKQTEKPQAPAPKQTTTTTKKTETKPAPTAQPTALPNTGAGDALFPAAGITGAAGYIGNLIRVKRKALK